MGTPLLDSITTKTNVDDFNLNKKCQLFTELQHKLSNSTGTISKENRFVIEKLSKSYTLLASKLVALTEENALNKKELARSKLIIEDLQLTVEKSKQEPNLLSYNVNTKESYSNALQNKKTEYPIVIKNTTGMELNVEEEVCRKLKSSSKRIDFLKIRKKEDKLIINTRNDSQRDLIIEKLSSDERFECKKPTKLIPAIMIYKLSKKWNEEELLNELCSNHEISREKSTIKILPSNPNFRTNRAILKCTDVDTIKINQEKEVKVGFMIHPIKMLYSVTQCYGCHGFNHFEFSRDKKTKTCKNRTKCGHCASENHSLSDCPTKGDMNQAKCCNCGGNHRSSSFKCIKKQEASNKVKEKYLC